MSKLNPPRLIANFSGKILECGCDEAGRGCLAGPVVAAAVIFAVIAILSVLAQTPALI